MASNLTSYTPIPADSDATTGLWDSRFSALQENVSQVNTDLNVRIAASVLDTQYSADSSGANDSTTSFQNALNDVAAQGGGICYVPTGDYLISSTLTLGDNVHLMGAGPRIGTSAGQASTISRGAGGTLFQCGGVNDGTRTRGVTITGITIDSQDSGSDFTGTAIDARWTSGLLLDRVEVVGNLGHAMHFGATFDSVVRDSWVRRSGHSTLGLAAIEVSNETDASTSRCDFDRLHSESNYHTHFSVTTTTVDQGAPIWVRINQSKFEDFASGSAESITAPMVSMTFADNPFISGSYIRHRNNSALSVAPDRGHMQVFILSEAEATPGYDNSVHIDGGSRSFYDLGIQSNTAPDTAKVLVSTAASNNFIQTTHLSGSGTFLSDNGTSTAVLQFADGFARLLSGNFGVGTSTPSEELHASGATIRIETNGGLLSGDDAGATGNIQWAHSSGETYLYLAVSANSWARVALEPF